jgi:carboxymethylenebutenolidase
MTEVWNARIPVDDGTMEGYLAGAEGRRPAVLVLQEIFGVNVAMRAVVDELAADGYLACAPDLFHRLEPHVALSYQPEDRPKALALWERFDQDLDQAVRDIRQAVAHMASHRNGDGRVGLVGFCLGGKLALLTLAAGSGDAAVSFYPVQMQKHRAAIGRIGRPVQVQLGSADGHIPPEVVEAIEADVAELPGGETIVHAGADHGFYNRFRSSGYSPEAAAAARARMSAFLGRTLGPSAPTA